MKRRSTEHGFCHLSFDCLTRLRLRFRWLYRYFCLAVCCYDQENACLCQRLLHNMHCKPNLWSFNMSAIPWRSMYIRSIVIFNVLCFHLFLSSISFFSSILYPVPQNLRFLFPSFRFWLFVSSYLALVLRPSPSFFSSLFLYGIHICQHFMCVVISIWMIPHLSAV